MVRLAKSISARWPHPDLSDPEALGALWEDVGHLELEHAEQAIRRLVTRGERFQPRGPAIMAVVGEMEEESRRAQREMEWEARHRQLGTGEPEGARDELVAVGRDLAERLRRKSAEAGLGRS